MRETQQDLLGDHSVMDPPDSMPNSVVKRNSADGSVGSPHVRVGHRQASNSFSSFSEKDEGKKTKSPDLTVRAFLRLSENRPITVYEHPPCRSALVEGL